MEPTPNKQQAGKKTPTNKHKPAVKKNKELRSPTKIVCSHEEVDHLSGQVGEFLDAYILIGYDLNGNAISVYAAKHQQHVDGLMTLLQNTAEDLLNKQRPATEE